MNNAFVIEVSATTAAADWTPMIIESKGIATSASPNPKVERVRDAANRIAAAAING
jgi:hypothetical protein